MKQASPPPWKKGKPWHRLCEDVIIDPENQLRIIGPNRKANAKYLLECVNGYEALSVELEELKKLYGIP